jgi:hypothetical protein
MGCDPVRTLSGQLEPELSDERLLDFFGEVYLQKISQHPSVLGSERQAFGWPRGRAVSWLFFKAVRAGGHF